MACRLVLAPASVDEPLFVSVACDTPYIVFSVVAELKPHVILLECNMPLTAKTPFVRSVFYVVPWSPNECDPERTGTVTVTCPGAFEYRFVVAAGPLMGEHTGFFVVEPRMTLGGRPLHPDAFCLQSVVTSCLGPLREWPSRLAVTASAGYNAVHFTPVQALGGSRSGFSLRDQLRLEPALAGTLAQLRAVLQEVRAPRAHGGLELFTVCDVVWNHTSPDRLLSLAARHVLSDRVVCSDWIYAHPECAFNLENSPHLKPAFVLDEALRRFSNNVVDGLRPHLSHAGQLNCAADVDALLQEFRDHILPKLKLWEFFVVDVAGILLEFGRTLQCLRIDMEHGAFPLAYEPIKLVAVRGASHDRFSLTIDVNVLLPQLAAAHEHTRQTQGWDVFVAVASTDFESRLHSFNMPLYDQVRADVDAALTAVRNTALYARFDQHGPRSGALSRAHPLANPCFARLRGWLVPGDTPTIDEACALADCAAPLIMAHNGWIWGGSARDDFAGPHSRAYFRRDVLAWTDSIKLRFGESVRDCPFLWHHMAEYTTQVASLFDGIRIDNCHSTPLHVGEFLVDVARAANRNLYVMAELFTGSQETDNLFAAKLGITHLIREAMAANDERELGRLVHRFGGAPIGSLHPVAWHATVADTPVFAFQTLQVARPGTPRALFYDCTHDNDAPAAKYTPEHTGPGAALAAMIIGGAASTRGVDEFAVAPAKVVADTRKYTSLAPAHSNGSPARADVLASDAAFLPVRRVLNALHTRLSVEGYSQLYLDHIGVDLFVVTRWNPDTFQAVTLVTRSAWPSSAANGDTHVPPLTLAGCVTSVLLHAVPTPGAAAEPKIAQPDNVIVGDCAITFRCVENEPDIEVALGPGARLTRSAECNNSAGETLHGLLLPPGGLVILALSPARLPPAPVLGIMPAVWDAAANLSLLDLNFALYRCSEEESGEGAPYDVPGLGPLPFCGLQGSATVLAQICRANALDHPLCQNLRAGTWLLDYHIVRLARRPATVALACALAEAGRGLTTYPASMLPAGCAHLLLNVCAVMVAVAVRQLGPLACTSALGQALALTSVQLFGPGRQTVETNEATAANSSAPLPTLSAGLPHFSHGWMRAWGRDTFVAFRGLFLVTGRFADARQVLLQFASVVRHGLVPNLFDDGVNPRFNCRDATWWFLHALQEYCTMAPEGVDVLSAPVERRFAASAANLGSSVVMPLHDVVQEMLQLHATGIHFREWGAGPALDGRMQPAGFQVDVTLDATTGFVHGGNAANCGTWMDKMGESSVAGNEGQPATPRDGAAIEIVALTYATVRWLSSSGDGWWGGWYPHTGVVLANDVPFSWGQWSHAIEASFEAHFWVPEDMEADTRQHCKSVFVHRRGMYKDTVGATHGWPDYQLRPNVCVALAVAPALFRRAHAESALVLIEALLVGELGMRTLDPGDMAYRPNYHNGVDSTDYRTARGFNYHQGPEWLWCVGYYLRARLQFGGPGAPAAVRSHLARYESYIASNPWCGLPEICNEKGVFCADGCPTQAWSAGCILDVLFELEKGGSVSM